MTNGISRVYDQPNKNVLTPPDKYYDTFSKYVLANNTMNANTLEEEAPAFTYESHCAKPVLFKEYKLCQLKRVAKHYHLHVSGNKGVLIERIQRLFSEITASVKIQRVFRGGMVRRSFRLRGVAFPDRTLCVNECDFYTLEPLSEIPFEQFFSYKDEKGFIYGFDLFSLLSLMKKTSRITNPYNRESIPYDTFTNLIGLYRLVQIVFPEACVDQCIVDVPATIRRPPPPPTETSNAIENQLVDVIAVYEPQLTVFNTNIPPEESVRSTLETIRTQTIDTRIRELFMEINLLGNYAESRWFTDLDRIRMARFYQNYYDWWHTRSRLPMDIKNSIYILGEPFEDIRLVFMYPTTTTEEFREACVRSMENMIYGSVDIECRKLGALQLLGILTLVSLPARNAMPWLYESIFSTIM